MSEIKVSENDIISKMTEFQAEVSKMDNLFESLKNEISAMGSFWSGDDSEVAAALLQQFTATFEPVMEKNKKYITFLTTTVEKYKEMDDRLSQNISTGDRGF